MKSATWFGSSVMAWGETIRELTVGVGSLRPAAARRRPAPRRRALRRAPRACHSLPEPSAALMACAAAGVGEGLARDRDELPAVAPVGQGQLQDPPGAAVTHLAVGKWGPKRVQAAAPRPHDKLENPPRLA